MFIKIICTHTSPILGEDLTVKFNFLVRQIE